MICILDIIKDIIDKMFQRFAIYQTFHTPEHKNAWVQLEIQKF